MSCFTTVKISREVPPVSCESWPKVFRPEATAASILPSIVAGAEPEAGGGVDATVAGEVGAVIAGAGGEVGALACDAVGGAVASMAARLSGDGEDREAAGDEVGACGAAAGTVAGGGTAGAEAGTGVAGGLAKGAGAPCAGTANKSDSASCTRPA